MIMAAFHGVRSDARILGQPMPGPYYAGRVSDSDGKAIVAYLRTLKPIAHKAPSSEPPATQ
jgi:hypothetical protein